MICYVVTRILLGGLLAAIALAACGQEQPAAPAPAPPTPAVVYMNPNSFSPFAVTIKVGESVTFEFPSLAHNVIFAKKTGAPADIPTTTNRSIARTFNTAGTFPYDCTLHPGMSGEVIVR